MKVAFIVIVCFLCIGVQSANDGANRRQEDAVSRLKRFPRRQRSDEIARATKETAETILATYSNKPVVVASKQTSPTIAHTDTNDDLLRLRQMEFEHAHAAIMERQRLRQLELRNQEFEHEINLARLERQREALLAHIQQITEALAQQKEQEQELAGASSSSAIGAGGSSSGTAGGGASSGGGGSSGTGPAAGLSSTGTTPSPDNSTSSTAPQHFIPGFIDHDPFAGGQLFQSESTGSNSGWPSPIADESDPFGGTGTAQPTGGFFTPDILPPDPAAALAFSSSAIKRWTPAQTISTIGATAAWDTTWQWRQKLRSQVQHGTMTPADDDDNVFSSLLQTQDQTKDISANVDEFSAMSLATDHADLVAKLARMDKHQPGWL